MPDLDDEFDANWRVALTRVFPNSPPATATWHSVDDIISVLNAIGATSNTNHLFFPTSGGLDLTGATPSVEQGCIELRFGVLVTIAKPISLTFTQFPDPQWSYFRIEAEPMTPTGVYASNPDAHMEELLDLGNEDYRDRSFWDAGNLGYDENDCEKPLPKHARIVSWCTPGGAFVVFGKGSIYNGNPGTYDARHNKMSSEQFRSHIQEVINAIASPPG